MYSGNEYNQRSIILDVETCERNIRKNLCLAGVFNVPKVISKLGINNKTKRTSDWMSFLFWGAVAPDLKI